MSKESLKNTGYLLGIIVIYVLVALVITFFITRDTDPDVKPLRWKEAFLSVILSGWIWVIIGAVGGFFYGKMSGKHEMEIDYLRHMNKDCCQPICPFCNTSKNHKQINT